MAVLLTKTMGQLNEERKPMYPLFEKPPKAAQSKKNDDLITIQHADVQFSIETLPKKTVVRETKKAKKAKKESLSATASNLQATDHLSGNVELFEVDPNSDRRKRRKTISPDVKQSGGEGDTEETRPLSPVRPTQERARGASGHYHTIQTDNTAKGTIQLGLGEKAVDRTGSPEALQNPGQQALDVQIPQPSESVTNFDTKVSILPSIANPGATEKSDDTTSILAFKDDPHTIKAMAHVVESKPKKILRLNPKTGTIGSPPAKKIIATPILPVSEPRSTSRVKQPRSKIVTIRYGHDEKSSLEISIKIDQILRGTKITPNVSRKKSWEALKATTETIVDAPKSPKIAGPAPPKPTTSLHPFFSGKPVLKPSDLKKIATVDLTSHELERTKEIAVLGRARQQSRDKPPLPSNQAQSSFTGFGSGQKMLKFPGAIEPAWPWQGMIHIRGNSPSQDEEEKGGNLLSELRSKAKKSKYQAVEVLAEEDIIGTLAGELCVNQVLQNIQKLNLDEYLPVPPCLRIPIKLFESGLDLQKRVIKELCARFPRPRIADAESSSEEDVQGRRSNRQNVPHQALSKLYTSIRTSLSAFDQFQCDTQPWIHKYSPKSAAEVLQTGPEAMILKEWLETLTVMSVESGAPDRSNSRASSVSRRSGPAKIEMTGKRKRKSKKLDGFVVSSDEEENDMDEISEPEDDNSPYGSQGLFKKTVIRAGDTAAKGLKDSVRFANAVVLSGPLGCGKTAAVYAVAKELDFEVFEINSSSRRSGKDILERVGDMTRNHLVQRSNDQAPADPVDEDTRRISDALADDLKSGRQGTMNSFFKPKEATKSKPKSIKSKLASKKTESAQTNLAPKAAPKKQKQSLILFEEVDVLYEEDKQFWATVMTLIVQSKRPIIMTCHDESVVPLQSLSLHAIIRLASAPVDLATDYMLLVAANEGHALKRDSVTALYESRHFDLRASIQELNFWCQFAVGDVKGGLDWYYPRWPVGCDVDMHGNKIRVVSEGTYEKGMGWLSRDFLESHLHYLGIEEEALHEVWEGWHLDIGEWQNIDMAGWADKRNVLSTGRIDDRAALSIYGDFADAMSVADLCSVGAFGLDNQVQLDINLPELSTKARDDYILSHRLLEATPLLSFDRVGLDISFWMKSRARNYLQVDQHVKHNFDISSDLDCPTESHIIDLIRNQIRSPESAIIREDFSLAFDPISEPEKTSLYNTGVLEASAFARSKTLIATDIAPYVRSIVSYDARLQQERVRMSNLLSEGSRKGKRMRTTRAAMSALEGGARSTTRKDKYFGPDLNPYYVLKTGMPAWLDAVAAEMIENGVGSRRFSRGHSDMSKVDVECSKDETLENIP